MREQMTMRVTIERNTQTGVDAYNQPLPPVWTTRATVPCYFFAPAANQRGEITTGDVNAVIGQARLLVPRRTDVTENDRVRTITDRQGTVLDPRTFDVLQVLPRRDHLLVVLRAVT